MLNTLININALEKPSGPVTSDVLSVLLQDLSQKMLALEHTSEDLSAELRDEFAQDNPGNLGPLFDSHAASDHIEQIRLAQTEISHLKEDIHFSIIRIEQLKTKHELDYYNIQNEIQGIDQAFSKVIDTVHVALRSSSEAKSELNALIKSNTTTLFSESLNPLNFTDYTHYDSSSYLNMVFLFSPV